jgi:hypothetical protein
MPRKKLPRPQTVRFQTSQRGVHFPDMKAARTDFLAWVDTGKSPAGAQTAVHIWQNEKERVYEKIKDGKHGEGIRLRAILKEALRSGRLQIRESRKSRG